MNGRPFFEDRTANIVTFSIIGVLLVAGVVGTYQRIYTTPAETARYYLEAVIDNDETTLLGLTCAASRQTIKQRLDASGGLPANAKQIFGERPLGAVYGSTFRTVSEQDNAAEVEVKIDSSSGLTMETVKENGLWRVCPLT